MTRMQAWLARLLIIGGAAALVWCAFIVTHAAVVQRAARETLESRRVEAPTPLSVLASSDPASTPAPRPSPGTPLAELSIPRVGLSAVVLEGTDARTLRAGLGHIETTALPGGPGHVAITGHRDSFFRRLQYIRVGDDVWLDAAGRRTRYRVAWHRVVRPAEIGVIAPGEDPMLTLVTCYPFRFVGPAPNRFVVRALPVDDSHAQERDDRRRP